MTTLEQAARQALETLERASDAGYSVECDETITALREALEQVAPRKTERWNPMYSSNAQTALQIAAVIAHRDTEAAPQQEAQEPVAWYEYNADLDAWFLAYSRNPKAKTRPLVFGDTAPQPAPATQQAGDVVAYLDVGAGGYLDLGSELSEDALQQLPKGRHALVIAGTYGIDGYIAAPHPSPTTKPAPQQAAPGEPCQTCIAMARTVMMDQVSFDRKPDCYGIRQITDDESVEEWADIRTSPDVAREEANDMMATGRGELYEVVPLWTTPQPAPAPPSEREAFERDWEKRHAPVPINGRTHDDGRYGDSSIQDAWESWQARAALAAQGGKV